LFRCLILSPEYAILPASPVREIAMFTRHAEVRRQRRGIRPEVVATLLDYGRRGAELCFMDRSARLRAKSAPGRDACARVADRLGGYVLVADDGDIITAAPRLKRLEF
jgi:hypothetical protein